MGGAGNWKWKAGVFCQHAGSAAERSDETAPSSASPAGNNGDPVIESSAAGQPFLWFCAVVKVCVCRGTVVFSPDPQRTPRSTFVSHCAPFPHLTHTTHIYKVKDGHFGNYNMLLLVLC